VKPLQGSDKVALDKLEVEWIAVDTRKPRNTASTLSFHRMMSTATAGRYNGCCEKTVQQHVSFLAVECRARTMDFVKELKEMGLKVIISGGLWSSHGTALFGIIIHGITKDWEMKELLAGVVPARLDAHTGEWVVEKIEARLFSHWILPPRSSGPPTPLTLDDIHQALRDNS
jgi:hypothetical protein